jgi:UDP-N-acetylglucosamine 2-epimerase (non-hydrolysing)
MKILVVFGTRPEAVKMSPLVQALKQNKNFETFVCVTGQHRQMLDQVLNLFEIKPDFDLNIMKPKQTLHHITTSVIEGITPILEDLKPDLVLVHGDVTTGFAAALAAFYQKIEVGHIEAGLRTGNIYSPFPEEMNRKLIGTLATYHFAPTESSKQNLLHDGIDEKNIFVTGNTVIDALLQVRDKILQDKTLNESFEEQFSYLDKSKKLILVTGHRRENLDYGITNVCKALANIVQRGDVQIVYPVHLNPKIKEMTNTVLKNIKDVFLIEPLDYLPFVYLMNRSYFIVTDSGGIQEEAPSLGKPVLVTRDTTERPEALKAGTVKLIGTDTKILEQEMTILLDDALSYNKMSFAVNPYGDGNSCLKIVQIINNISIN